MVEGTSDDIRRLESALSRRVGWSDGLSLWQVITATMAFIGVAACTSSRDDMLRRFETAVARAAGPTWGEAAVPNVLATERAQFACLWDRLKNPEEELSCRIANLEAASRCLDLAKGDDGAQQCWTAPESWPCSQSAEFRAAVAACIAESGHPYVTP